MSTFSMADALSFRVGLDTAQVKRGLGTVKREAMSTGKAMKAAFLPAVGIIASAGAAMFTLTKSMSDAVDKANALSSATGLEVETIGSLEYALEGAGVSLGQYETGFRTLIQRMDKGSAAFDTLGVSVRDADGNLRNSGDVIRDVSAGLRNVDSATQRAAIGAELFGARSQALANILPGLNDDLERGAELTASWYGPEAQAASAAFDVSMRDMNASLTTAKTELATEFTPSVTTAMDSVASMVGPVIELWKAIKWVQDTLTPVGWLMSAWLAIMDDSPVESYTEKVARLTGNTYLLTGATDELTESTEEFDDAVQRPVRTVGTLAEVQAKAAESARNYAAAQRELDREFLQQATDLMTLIGLEESLASVSTTLAGGADELDTKYDGMLADIDSIEQGLWEINEVEAYQDELRAAREEVNVARMEEREALEEAAHDADMMRIMESNAATKAAYKEKRTAARALATEQASWAKSTAVAELGAIATVMQAISERSDLTVKESKRAAMAAFIAQKASSIAQIVVSGIEGVSKAGAMFGFPSPVGIAAVIAAGAFYGLQAAAVLAAPAPEFATGGIIPMPVSGGSPDHGLVGVSVAPGESLEVMDRRATGDGSAARSSRRSRDGLGGSQTVTLNSVWQGRVIDQVMYDTVSAPSTKTARAVSAASRTPSSHYAR